MSKYVKILHESLIHHNYKYNLGLNIDLIPFNSSGECQSGGLYYTDFDKFPLYLNYGTLIADVEIPEDAKIYKGSAFFYDREN